MAWNEPGGGRDNDPWGGGGNNQGPPDLDEALRKFQERINGLFGGNGGGASDGGLGAGAIGAIALLLVLVWGAFGFYQVDEQERAVVLRFGVFNEITAPGLHWHPPIVDTIEIVNTTKVRSREHGAEMLTQDENIVGVQMEVQYTINDPSKFVLQVDQPERSLAHALESSLRHVVGSSKMDQVITEGREQIALEVHARLQQYIDTYQTGIQVAKVNIKDAYAPAQVQDAFDDVTRAREDRERLKNEADAYANSIIPEARGAAQRQLEEANAYREQVVARAEGEADRFIKLMTEYKKAPEVTRQRLYIEAMQDVFGGVNKVLVDVDGGNNMMYLPLDRLTQGVQQTPQSAPTVSDVDLRELTNRVVEQLRRDSRSSNRREGR